MKAKKQPEEWIAERQVAILLGVCRASILNWRRSVLIPDEIWIEKKYPSGQSRFFYKKDSLLNWYQNKI
jgi:hypothetical protein